MKEYVIKPKQINHHEMQYTMFLKNNEIANVKVYEFNDVYNINDFYVNFNFRNFGIGTIMLEFIINQYRNKPLELGVREDNFVAIKLYSKFGFKTEDIFYIENIKMLRQIRKV